MTQPGPPWGADHDAGMGPSPQGPSFDAPRQSPYGPAGQPPPGHQPIGAPIPNHQLSSDQFRPPKDRRPLWIVAIVVAVVVLVVATASVVAWRSDLRQQNTPTAEPSVPSSLPTPSGNGIDFVSPEGSGRLDIVDSDWSGNGLQVKLRLTVTEGEVQYGLYNFQAFDEAGNTYESSIQEVPVPALGEGDLSEGQTTEGWLAFQVPRQDVTMLLISEYGKAITAYKIDG